MSRWLDLKRNFTKSHLILLYRDGRILAKDTMEFHPSIITEQYLNDGVILKEFHLFNHNIMLLQNWRNELKSRPDYVQLYCVLLTSDLWLLLWLYTIILTVFYIKYLRIRRISSGDQSRFIQVLYGYVNMVYVCCETVRSHGYMCCENLYIVSPFAFLCDVVRFVVSPFIQYIYKYVRCVFCVYFFLVPSFIRKSNSLIELYSILFFS